MDGWLCYHHGEFEQAVAIGQRHGIDGQPLVDQATCIYADYLEPREALRLQLFRQVAERAASRKEQVGSGDRSERIRTYNFPQGRVTDHRINLTLHRLPEILEGEMDELVGALIAEDEAERLAALDG